MSAAGCHDDQRLVGEVTESRSLLRRDRRLDELVDRGANIACGRDAGAYLVPGPRRQAAEGELAVQACACRKPRPQWSGRSVSVLVEDGTQPIMSLDREPGDRGGVGDRLGEWAQWPGVGEALVGSVPVVM